LAKGHHFLGFIPLCNPIPNALEKPRKFPTFTEVELERFQERYKLEAKKSTNQKFVPTVGKIVSS